MSRFEIIRRWLNESDNWETHDDALERTGFWGTKGAGCIFLAKSRGRILLPFRSPYVQEGECWGTWGGAIDRGMTPEQAVKNEVKEEAGYKGNFELIPLVVFKHKTFEYHNFLAIVEEEFEPELNWENDKAEWFEYEEFLNVEPKHNGLKYLIEHSRNIIESNVNNIKKSFKK
jgi:8-oxo-dGTP pyrophosphatase MutT (NUDIX family)